MSDAMMRLYVEREELMVRDVERGASLVEYAAAGRPDRLDRDRRHHGCSAKRPTPSSTDIANEVGG